MRENMHVLVYGFTAVNSREREAREVEKTTFFRSRAVGRCGVFEETCPRWLYDVIVPAGCVAGDTFRFKSVKISTTYQCLMAVSRAPALRHCCPVSRTTR